MKDVIQKLDIRRRQVYVEAAIIEMSLSKQRELGFEMQVPINQSQFDAGQTTAVGGTNFGGIGSAVVGGPAAIRVDERPRRRRGQGHVQVQGR